MLLLSVNLICAHRRSREHAKMILGVIWCCRGTPHGKTRVVIWTPGEIDSVTILLLEMIEIHEIDYE